MQYRKSFQRKKILEVLQNTASHPTADWIYKKLKDEIPDLSLGTVYRNLAVLMEQGQIIKLPFGSTFDRYDGNISPHYHFVCEKCGEVADINLAVLSEINRKAQQHSGFLITGHRLEFYGICKNCRGN